MDDLISRGEAKRKLAYVLKSYGMEHVKNRIFDALNRCKAVDAAPVVHGRVLENGNPICGPCSECGESVNRKWHFCPSCGAHMDLPDPPEEEDQGFM